MVKLDVCRANRMLSDQIWGGQLGFEKTVLSEHIMGVGIRVHNKFLRSLFSQELPAATG